MSKLDPEAVIVQVRKDLYQIEVGLGNSIHSLHELYIMNEVDNRLAKTVLENIRQLVSQVRNQLKDGN
jgi:hypothetical protein